ncbi:uncharacterized protein TRIADDRAFT_56379 [Trichoplax adhaerens]|uniref:TraB domain-containing protein n=1 Tax=Trichoplax adhaerens TaxID=10228 RepID=B3RXZ0_TRIAD|nr:hypothetical protein TRIADDRAFT_56379 [Trichoplax adhaerens]EDV24943.1 hypothetical protein TRIADDRAFT_56379 [Trichoplax adhaerens]|eukprot:XP_002112833.1 hypothetical protein TRIADDRAFT_56379 [Trichoplax adhaerens]
MAEGSFTGTSKLNENVPEINFARAQRDDVEDEVAKYLLRKQTRKDINSYDLPPSVIKFDNQRDNSSIYLIGTAHFSKESCREVEELIRAVQPDVVMIELCRSRASIATISEKRLIDEAENMDLRKVRSVISQNGVLSGIVHLLFINLTASITKQLGVAPGCEFRAAVKEAS